MKRKNERVTQYGVGWDTNFIGWAMIALIILLAIIIVVGLAALL